MKELILDATTENLNQVLEFVEGELESLDASVKTAMQINIAVEEIFVNVAHYAYAPEIGKVTVQLDVEKDPAAVKITFIDKGVPYNPLEKEDPDITLSAEDRQIGGLGIFMVKKSMDEVEYVNKDGCNIFSIKKIL